MTMRKDTSARRAQEIMFTQLEGLQDGSIPAERVLAAARMGQAMARLATVRMRVAGPGRQHGEQGPAGLGRLTKRWPREA